MKTREDLKKELKTLSKDELIEAIMISPMVTGFILKKCKPKNEKKEELQKGVNTMDQVEINTRPQVKSEKVETR